MPQKNFRQFFLENVLDFLWRQWSELGAAGGARPEDEWVIDPEALLVFSLEFARYEPRLFDEILNWLCVNGRWIDMQRLRGILKNKDLSTRRLTGAVAQVVVNQKNDRKWNNLARSCEEENRKIKGAGWIEPLFREKSDKDYPLAGKPDAGFLRFGFNREPFILRESSQRVSFGSGAGIRFLLRALFGIGSRSECILYLLTHESGHPSEIASAIGISVRGTQDALIELADSGLVLTRAQGRRKVEYWLSPKRWWEFLKNQPLDGIEPPLRVNWIAVFNALSGVWDVLREIDIPEASDYMKSSKLHEAIEVSIAREFSKSGLDIPPPPGRGISIEEYAQRFEEFIKRVLGTNK